MQRIKLTLAITSLAALAATTAPLDAQGRGKGPQGVPPGHMPPAGMCRVWYDGVPPGRQPAPTSCARAERTAGRNARVIYGPRTDRRTDRRDERRDERRDDGRYDGRYDGRRDGDERRRVDDPRRGSDCVDRNRDGWCDYVGDGRYDGRYDGRPDGSRSALPVMPSVSDLRADRLSRDQRAWLGSSGLRPQYLDQNRDGRPEVIHWRDSRGRTVQRWTDDDRNGRVDRVTYYDASGRMVREVR
ncbi:MAG TPA: hypothetical protein VFX39_10680 [Gemmatimonadaceae bacterium]|nr:hypothetical protein [Gemmatimonadaceae bacterium]